VVDRPAARLLREPELDAEPIPLVRSFRLLRGESEQPSRGERAIDDAFAEVQGAIEKARRIKRLRRVLGSVLCAATLVSLVPAVRALVAEVGGEKALGVARLDTSPTNPPARRTNPRHEGATQAGK
jgi:hypothetical protein